MLLTFYLLFIGLRVSEGCTLENTEKVLKLTAFRGESVLLPCYCTDLHTKPKIFSWTKQNSETSKLEEISNNSGQYRNRVQLFDGHSPGNLSLLISHLTEEDGGSYWCEAENNKYVYIKLTIEGGSTKSTVTVNTSTSPTTAFFQRPGTLVPVESTAPSQTTVPSMHFFIFIPILLLLLGLGGIIYCRHRGRRRGQMESREKRGTRREQETQDQVTYSTVVHSNRTSSPTVIDTGNETEYVTIRLN
ncbi:uncharacterized protein LOC118816062 [Colossoma macropomum]|uniref:uncharacterized protein LOC118816062 n=1 Tax=Colossoma macropomum TaxID=42526 RepID=UPI00186512F8|nr:uncharacterized protein LOC118816062 [Colossoma macropomum]